MSAHDDMRTHVAPPDAAGTTERRQAPAFRLVSTLAFAGGLAGMLIVVAFQWAQPRIAAYQELMFNAAVGEVLGAPDSTRTLYLVGDALEPAPPSAMKGVSKVVVGYRDGQRVGYALQHGEPGFADVITVIFGYDTESGQVLGMKVLDNRETPGLGDKIVKDSAFLREFRAVQTPLRGVKSGAGKGEPGEVDMITGATISSRAVIAIINHKLERVRPVLDRYEAGERP